MNLYKSVHSSLEPPSKQDPDPPRRTTALPLTQWSCPPGAQCPPKASPRLPGWAGTVLHGSVQDLSLLSVQVPSQRGGEVKAKGPGSLRVRWEGSPAMGRVRKGVMTIRDVPQWQRDGNSNPQWHLSHHVWLPSPKSHSTPGLGSLCFWFFV